MTGPTGCLDNLSILVIEDEFVLAREIVLMLELVGATVLGPFREDISAVMCAAGMKPDCAIVDLDLGRGPAFSHVRALLAQGVPLLIYTGYDLSILPVELLDLPRLLKPSTDATIIKAVAKLCGRTPPPIRSLGW